MRVSVLWPLGISVEKFSYFDVVVKTVDPLYS